MSEMITLVALMAVYGQCAVSNEWSCPVGYYGPKCNLACGRCAGKGSCDQINGRCYQGCLGRYFGRKCQHECPSTCGGDGSCYIMTGYCKHGCKPGFFSLKCQNFCPDTCGGDGSCDINVPVCRNGCQLGHYGWLCQDRCSCLNGTACERVSGNCLDTQINSRKTTKQQSSSTDNIFKLTSPYLPNTKVVACSKCIPPCSSQGCSKGCFTGFFGRRCTSRCDCAVGTPCQQRTGTCRTPGASPIPTHLMVTQIYITTTTPTCRQKLQQRQLHKIFLRLVLKLQRTGSVDDLPWTPKHRVITRQ